MNRKRMLLTTTSSLDGWTVQEYLGPVSAEVVIGTGLFTEFFSSWTDAFGMESHAHQGKLDLIKQRALAGIEYKALRLGANAVIGLRVDHDEISAGGKSLLMVTAMGTAVRAHRLGATADPHARSRAGAISAYELGVNRDRARLLRQAEAGKLDLGDARTWDFVVDNKVVELAPHVLKRAVLLQSQFSYNPVERDRAWAPLKEFFLRLEPEQAAEALYAALAGPDAEADFALQVIREAGLLDVPRVTAMLQGGNETVRARVLQVVRADQPFYTPDDIAPLQALSALVPTVFVPAPTVKKKGLMGEKEVWMCACGEPVDTKFAECGNCTRDRYGIPRKWVRPGEAVRLLDEKISLLRAQFPEAEGCRVPDAAQAWERGESTSSQTTSGSATRAPPAGNARPRRVAERLNGGEIISARSPRHSPSCAACATAAWPLAADEERHHHCMCGTSRGTAGWNRVR